MTGTASTVVAEEKVVVVVVPEATAAHDRPAPPRREFLREEVR